MSQGYPGQPWGQQQWGQHQWGQQPMGQQQWPAPTVPTQPPTKRGPGPIILGALIVVAVAMLGFVLYSLLSGPDYQNDDYEPPPPGPTSPLPDIRISEADAILSDNPLYAQQIPVPVRCELQTPDINLDTATDAEVQAHLDDIMACLMRVWDPPFRSTQRFESHRPVVNVYHESITTPCGEQEDPSAFYCMVNQQIYLSRQYAQVHPNLSTLPRPRVVDAVMAHEFGHSVQARNGILLVRLFKSQDLEREEALELSRRVEAQADCFAGLYFRSVQQSIGLTQEQLGTITEYRRLVGSDELSGTPDDPDVITTHPHGRSRVYWFQTGLTSDDVGACNTFTAPSDYVR